MEEKIYLGKTSNGKEIYMIENSVHMLAHSGITSEILAEAIEHLGDRYTGPFGMYEVDFGRIIGTDNCVAIESGDDVRMMYRKGRQGKSPVVFGKEPAETTILTIGICTDSDDELKRDTIFTAFTGQLAPKEPWDPRLKDEERAESERFWASYALVCKPEELDDERN